MVAADLLRTGQEHEHASRRRTQRQLDRACRPKLQRFRRAAADMLDPDREQAALAAHHRRAAEMGCHRAAVERRRHDDEPQVWSQGVLHLEAQSQAEIRVQRALVELIEDHGAVGLQRRIALQIAGEQPFGDDFDPGVRADAAVEPHGIADRVADRLAQ